MTVSHATRTEFERPATHGDAVKASAATVRFLVVPECQFLTVDGRGAPGDDAFRDAMGALYPVAYTLHFALKRREIAAPVGLLEGLYWVRPGVPIPLDIFGSTSLLPQDWHWRLMMPVPAAATPEDVLAAIDQVALTKSPRALGLMRVEWFMEGHAAQVMHVGPYDGELPTVTRLHGAIADAGLRPSGCHHEIYVSDPNRTPSDRIRTVIRQPVEP